MTFILATPSEVQRELGSRLRMQRLNQGLPQKELGAKAGLSLGAIRKLERDGSSSLDTLIKVVHALGLITELDELFRLKALSIAQMEKNAQTGQRQRASSRKKP